MLNANRWAWLAVAAAVTGSTGVLFGCAQPLPPATALGAPPTPAPTEGSIVFARPSSPCDVYGWQVVVDANGRFVGNLAAGTKLTLPVKPGTHVFYSWSTVDWRLEAQPAFNPATATRVTVMAGETRYVGFTHINAPHCSTIPILVMAVARSASDEAELSAATKMVVADRSAGQAKLEEQPAHLQTYLELGRWKLSQLDEDHAREARRAAMAAEGE